MSRSQIERSAGAFIGQFGKSTAHFIYPDEFDYYLIAFEVVDKNDRPVDYMAFPVNPESINYNVPASTTVEKTFGGVVTQKSVTFNPKNISLSGNFGKKFKFILGGRPLNFSALNFNFNSLNFKNFSIEMNEFNAQLKTGYGCIKVLERIIEMSKSLDEDGDPYRVFFYNTSLNQQFLVEFENDYDFSVSVSKNMIWNYNIRLKAVANLNDIDSFNSKVLANLLLNSNLSKMADRLVSRINLRLS